MKNIFLSLIFLVSYSLLANHDNGTFALELSGDMGYLYGITDINDKITTNGSGIVDFMPDAGKLRFNYNFGFALGYSFHKRFRALIYADYIMLKKSFAKDIAPANTVYTGTGSATAGYFEFNTGIYAIGVGPIFVYNFADAGNFAFSISAGFMYYPIFSFFQDTTYGSSSSDSSGITSNLSSVEGSSRTWGAMTKLSMDYYMNKHFAIGLYLGYTYIKAPSLSDASGNDINFKFLDGSDPSGGAAPLALNISNISAGIAFKTEFGGSSSEKKTESTYEQVKEVQNTVEQPVEEITPSDSIVSSDVYSDQQLDISEIKNLKHKAQRMYRRAKRKKYYRRKKRLGKIHTYIKKAEKRWYKLSYEEQEYYIKKINKKLKNSLRVR